MRQRHWVRRKCFFTRGCQWFLGVLDTNDTDQLHRSHCRPLPSLFTVPLLDATCWPGIWPIRVLQQSRLTHLFDRDMFLLGVKQGFGALRTRTMKTYSAHSHQIKWKIVHRIRRRVSLTLEKTTVSVTILCVSWVPLMVHTARHWHDIVEQCKPVPDKLCYCSF